MGAYPRNRDRVGLELQFGQCGRLRICLSGLTVSGLLGWGQCDEFHLFKGRLVHQFVSSVVRKQFDGQRPLGDGGVEVVAPCEVDGFESLQRSELIPLYLY